MEVEFAKAGVAVIETEQVLDVAAREDAEEGIRQRFDGR
jgi:hypothetical protein